MNDFDHLKVVGNDPTNCTSPRIKRHHRGVPECGCLALGRWDEHHDLISIIIWYGNYGKLRCPVSWMFWKSLDLDIGDIGIKCLFLLLLSWCSPQAPPHSDQALRVPRLKQTSLMQRLHFSWLRLGMWSGVQILSPNCLNCGKNKLPGGFQRFFISPYYLRWIQMIILSLVETNSEQFWRCLTSSKLCCKVFGAQIFCAIEAGCYFFPVGLPVG